MVQEQDDPAAAAPQAAEASIGIVLFVFSAHKKQWTEKTLCIKFLRGGQKTPFRGQKNQEGCRETLLQGLKNSIGVGKTPRTGVRETPPGGQFDPWGARESRKPSKGTEKHTARTQIGVGHTMAMLEEGVETTYL